MPRWGYSYQGLREEKIAKASLREVDVSPKWSRELCRALLGLTINQARSLCEDIINFKRPIHYKRYNKNRGHRRGLGSPGGFPVKAAKLFSKLLDSLEANAEFKGLDPEKMKIVHAVAYKGRKIYKTIPRAFGRSTPYIKQLVHVELVAEED